MLCLFLIIYYGCRNTNSQQRGESGIMLSSVCVTVHCIYFKPQTIRPYQAHIYRHGCEGLGRSLMWLLYHWHLNYLHASSPIANAWISPAECHSTQVKCYPDCINCMDATVHICPVSMQCVYGARLSHYWICKCTTTYKTVQCQPQTQRWLHI